MADRRNHEALFGHTLTPEGLLRSVSPSAYTAFKRCGLRWHFSYKEKVKKKPMGKGAAQGQKSHDLMDTFLTTGQDVRGPLELVGKDMIAPYLWAAPFMKGPGLVEGPLLEPRIMTPGGILIAGYYDFYIPGLNGHETGFEWPIVIDHKFKKDLDKWGVDEDELADDPQTLVYGTWALARQPTVDGVVVRHHQHQTSGEGGRFPRPVEVRLTRDDLLRRWGAMAKVIDTEMTEAARVPVAAPGATPEGVPFNTLACGDFGGCDFAGVCRHSPMNQFTGALRRGAEAAKGFLNLLPTEAKPMGLLNQATTIATAQTPAASTPQTQEQMEAALRATLAQSAPKTIPEIPVSQCKPGGVYMLPGGPTGKFEAFVGSRPIFRMVDGSLKDCDASATVRDMNGDPVTTQVHAAPTQAQTDAKAEKKRKLGIVDVDEPGTTANVAPPDVAKTVTVQATPPAVVVVSTAEAIASPPAVQTAPNPPAAQTTVTPPAAEPEKPKKVGRPSNAEKDAQAAASGVIAGSAGSAAKPLSTQPDGVIGEPTSGKLFLLVNCSSNRATDLAGYVKSLCDAVATAHGAPDVRLGQKQSDLAFGGWKALVAIKAAAEPPSGLCMIRSSELADPVIEALIPLAAVVVTGGA